MKKALVMVVILLSLALLNAKIEVISESSDYLLLEFRLGEFSLTETNEHLYFSAPGLGTTSEVGAPLLPINTYYVGIPENGNIEFRIVDIERSEHRLKLPILPVPEIIAGKETSEYIYTIDEAKYRRPSSPLISKEDPTYLRYNPVIPISISPVDYDYDLGKINVAQKITLEIRIQGDTTTRNQQFDQRDLITSIINYESAQHWQNRDEIAINHAPFAKSDFWYSFEVSHKGMHELTYQQLSSLPLEDIDPRTIRIFSTGGALLPNSINNTGYPFREIPIMIPGEEDGFFEQDDKIIFYAQARDGFEQNDALSLYYNPYSARTVYWLTFGGNFADPPNRITWENYPAATLTKVSSPEYAHFESEVVKRDQTGFTWFTAILSGSTDTNHNYNFTAQDVDPNKEQSLMITLQAAIPSFPEETVTNSFSFTVNGNLVVDRQNWLGISYRYFTQNGFFTQSGTNNVVLTMHRTINTTVYFDYFRIRYYRFLNKTNSQLLFSAADEDANQVVDYKLTGNSTGLFAFQIDDFYQVSQLPVELLPNDNDYDFRIRGAGGNNSIYAVVKDGEYHSVSNFNEVIPVDLTAESQPVEALIIYPEEFSDYAGQLSQLYSEKEGLISKTVKQQDIFDQFNSGMPDPNAIRLYLRYAFYNYPSTPQNSLKFVTLLGSGTIDWRNYSGQAAEKNRIIVFQRSTRTSEDFFVDQTGNTIPDLAIGRIPIQEITQAETVLGKINEYWNNPAPGLWRNTLLFVADDEYKDQHIETIHSRDIQLISEEIDPGVIIDKVMGLEYPFDTLKNKPQARDDIVAAVNEGRLVWLYVGHGAYDRLGDENYFRVTDIPLLNNPDKLNLFMAASCSVSQYQFVGLSSLSERLLWHEYGGSIGSLGATGLTTSSPNKNLMENFLKEAVNLYRPPGLALMLAKQQASSGQTTNNSYYTYLGDPVLPIVPPERTQNLSIKNDPDSLFAYQKVEIEGSIPQSQNGIVNLYSYSSEFSLTHIVTANQAVIEYSNWGRTYFKGRSELINGQYEAAFIVPGDIMPGDMGRIISYHFDPANGKDYIDYYYPKILTNIPYAEAVPDTIPPEVIVWLDTEDFRDGDIVSPNPTLYARIHDESGINILGELGHKILIMLDLDSSPLDVTSGFVYELGSYQTGNLTWQLTDLSEGSHTLKLIVFDNYNNPTVTDVSFYIILTEKVVIEEILPYPNPISDSGHFTFILNAEAQITITIYTITGRRIRTISAPGIQGFNKVFWDGRDQEGSRIANNTYLYKIRAKQPMTNKVTEALGKVIILR